jgi:hypothetical protein
VTQSSLSARLPFSMVQPHLGLDGFDAPKVGGLAALRTAHGHIVRRGSVLTGLPTSLPAPDRNTRTLSFYLHTYNVNAPSGGQARQGPQTHSIHSRTPSVHSDTRPGTESTAR